MSNLSMAKSKSTTALMPTTTALRLPPVKLVDDHQRRVSAEEMKKTIKDATSHLYLIPTLYTTSESTSLPPDSMSSSPSPYIVNHKRRGATLLKSLSQTDVAVAPEVDLVAVGSYSDLQLQGVEERCGTPISVDSISSQDENDIKPDDTVPVLDIEFASNPLYVDVTENELIQGDDLLDFRETASVVSCITEATDDGNELQRLSKPPSTPLGEFYDAYEEKARQRRIRRKRIQKWIWISIGITIAVGTTTAMSSYLQVSSTSPFSEAKCAAESKP